MRSLTLAGTVGLASIALAACSVPDVWKPAALADLPRLSTSSEPPPVRAIGEEWYPVDAATVALLAAERSHAVTQGLLGVEAALVAEDQAQRAMWPSIHPLVRYYQLDGLTQGTVGNFVDVDKQNLTIGAGIALDLELVESRAQAIAARQARRASESASAASRRRAVLEALELLDDLLASQNELAITRELEAGARSVADLERARERQGAGLAADRLRAEAREAEAQGDVLRAEAAFRDASTRLAERLRVDSRVTLFAAEPEVVALTLIEGELDLGALIVEALENRPEVEEARLLVEAASEQERGVRNGRWMPRLFAGAGSSGFGPNFGDLNDQDVVEVGLAWDLSPSRWGRHREFEVEVQRGKLELVRTREAITAEVVRSVEFARVSPQAIESAGRRVEASLEALEVVRDRREAGSALLVELLEAQRQLALARRSLMSAILEHNRTQRRLQYSLGR